MEGGESVLDAIFEEDTLEDVQDVDMMDLEEGELVEHDSQTELGQTISSDVNTANQESGGKVGRPKNKKQKKKKKKKRKNDSAGPVTDINRFVLDVCKQLREPKTYLVYSAVGLLGVSALSDLIKEVGAIQACGGQKTADGRRYRFGGGILWSVLKTRDPNSYKEIMKRGKEFEKQFRQQNIKQGTVPNKVVSSERMDRALTDQTTACSSDGLQPVPCLENQLELSKVEDKRSSVYDRMRVPVAYDDDLLREEEEDPNEKSA